MSFILEGSQGSESLGNLPKVTQLVSDRAGIWTKQSTSIPALLTIIAIVLIIVKNEKLPKMHIKHELDK